MVSQPKLGEPVPCKSAAEYFVFRIQACSHLMPLPVDRMPIHENLALPLLRTLDGWSGSPRLRPAGARRAKGPQRKRYASLLHTADGSVRCPFSCASSAPEGDEESSRGARLGAQNARSDLLVALLKLTTSSRTASHSHSLRPNPSVEAV